MTPLSIALRQGTAADHRRAERAGIVADMLRDSVTRAGYRLFLRNLHEVYVTLERSLSELRSLPEALRNTNLFRAPSIASDLKHLAGDGWHTKLPVLSSAREYCQRIETLSREKSSGGLAAHAYVRYLGDLSGGQLLAKRLARSPGLAPQELSFYQFDGIENAQIAKRMFRDALDELCGSALNQEKIVEEARRAFQHNIELSCDAKVFSENGIHLLTGPA